MSDVKEVHGLMPHVHTPIITGRSFSGIVEFGFNILTKIINVLGDESLKGKEVWGVGGDLGFSLNGTHAKFVKIHKDAVRTKPKKVSFQQAGFYM